MPKEASIHSGDKFGLLTAIDRLRDKSGLLIWRFKCDCGNEVLTNGQQIRRGQWKSCGCAMPKGENHPGYKHGKKGTRVYRIWSAMQQRCHNPNQPHWVRYGGKGISVCEKWLSSFEAFYADMGDPPTDKHSIDRYPNPAGNYEPGNCRWATAFEQRHNRQSNLQRRG